MLTRIVDNPRGQYSDILGGYIIMANNYIFRGPVKAR